MTDKAQAVTAHLSDARVKQKRKRRRGRAPNKP
jgi:hypothetical protein